MNKELNELMADVMGWHKERIAPHTSNPLFWHDEQGNSLMYCYAWHPDTDLNQARDCLTKLCKDAYCHAELFYNYIDNTWLVQIWNEVPVTDTDADIESEIRADKLPLAICEAIKQAVKNG